MKLSKVLLTALLPLPLFFNGCGSSANDQGTTFSLIGFGQLTIDTTTLATTCSDTVFTNQISVPRSDATEGSGTVIGCLVIQNNLTSTSVRTERVNLSYYINGASEQPPSTNTVGTVLLGPAASSATTTTTTTSTGLSSLGNKISLPANLIPPVVREWISVNRSRLPSPPYNMDIIASVTGVSTSGDQLTTNEASIQATITQDVLVGTGGASGTTTPTATPAA